MWSTLHLLKHQRSYFPLCILNWPNEKFCKSDESGWSSFPVHLQQVSCVKPSKAQRSYFHLTPNKQAVKGWRLWSHLVWNRESCLECISRCGTQLSWKRKSTILFPQIAEFAIQIFDWLLVKCHSFCVLRKTRSIKAALNFLRSRTSFPRCIGLWRPKLRQNYKTVKTSRWT